MKFIEKIHQIWKDHDLRRSILFVLGLLIIFRIAAHIPLPGVDANALRQFFDSNAILGLLNIFSGGGMTNFSLVALTFASFFAPSFKLGLALILMLLLAQIPPSRYQLWAPWLFTICLIK